MTADDTPGDVLSMALDLHGDATGAGPDAYAEWGPLGGARGRERDLDYLEHRLRTWREPSCAFDLAVRAVLRAVLEEHGRAPMGGDDDR